MRAMVHNGRVTWWHVRACVFIQVTQIVFNFSLMTYTCPRIFLSPPWLMVLCQRWSASNGCSVLSVWWFTCVCAILNYVEEPFPTHFIDISVLGGWSALYHVGIFYIPVLFPSTHIRLTRPGCPINFYNFSRVWKRTSGWQTNVLGTGVPRFPICEIS